MSELSTAAQAVYDAWFEAIDTYSKQNPPPELAAALRAAALQLREAYANETYIEPADDWLDSIATELENAQ